jgi:hypothetical protein
MELVERISCVLACIACELAIMSASNNLTGGWLRKWSWRGEVGGRCYIYCSGACCYDVTGGVLTAYTTP